MKHIRLFKENVQEERISYRDWVSLRRKEGEKLSELDIRSCNKLIDILNGDPSLNYKVKMFDTEIRLEPIRYDKTVLPTCVIMKYKDGYSKKLSNLFRMYGDSYEERGGEYYFYKTDNIGHVIKSGIYT